MTASVTCDNCGETLLLDVKGRDSSTGEDAAWLIVRTRGFSTEWDACTLSCAAELMKSGDVRQVVESELEAIAAVVRAINSKEEGPA